MGRGFLSSYPEKKIFIELKEGRIQSLISIAKAE